MELKTQFKEIAEKYVITFLTKHNFHENGEITEWRWIRDNAGGVLEVSDYFINFDDIRFDIDNEVPADQFFEWYDHDLNLAMKNRKKRVNYENWLKGVR